MEVILTIRRLITLLLLINGCYVSSHVTSTGSQFSGHNVSPDRTPVPTSIDQPSMTASALEGSMTSSLNMMTHSDTSLASPDTVTPSFSVSPTLMPSASSAASAETPVDSLGTIGGITMSTDLKTESTGSVETAFSTNSTTILQTSPFESPLTATVSIGTSDVFSSGFSDLVVKPSSVITESAEQPTDSSSLTGTINPSNFMDTTHNPEKTTIPSSADTVVPTTILDTVGTSTAMPILPSPTTSLPMPTSSLPVDETKPNADHNKGGLTNGGKAALGICIPIIIILVIVGIIYLFYRKRHYTASWKLSDVVSYRPWSYNNATYYDDESTLIIPSLK